MKGAIVVGTGGHSRVVLSMLEVAGITVLGLIDLGIPRVGELILGFPVLGAMDQLDRFSGRIDVDLYLAVGDNVQREGLYRTLSARGFTLPNLVANNAYVDRHAHLGEANVICARAHVGPLATLGNNNLINTGAIIEHETVIGSHCHLAPASVLAGRSSLGSLSTLSASATVIDSVHIAPSTLIGAGAVVIRNIEQPSTVWVGVPARRLERPCHTSNEHS